MAFNHVHNPQYCSAEWCNTSSVTGNGPAIPTGHGGTGSAVQEMDWSVGQIMAALKGSGEDENTLVVSHGQPHKFPMAVSSVSPNSAGMNRRRFPIMLFGV
jgi:hypothetical protein